MPEPQENEVDIESLEVKLCGEDKIPVNPPKLLDSKSEDPRIYRSSSQDNALLPALVRRASEPVSKPLHSWHLEVPLPRAMGAAKSLRISLKRPTFYCSICMEVTHMVWRGANVIFRILMLWTATHSLEE